MNRYHILIITGVQSYNSHEVEAERLIHNDAGFYQFTNSDGRILACYPIGRSIVKKIEYDIKQQTQNV